VIACRRYRCVSCGAILTVVPRGVAPRFGFQQLSMAMNVGQAEDWGLSLPDGSRIHLWLMPDGRWIAHRDATDPSLSPLHAAVHVLTATPLGVAVAFLGVVGLTAVAMSRA